MPEIIADTPGLLIVTYSGREVCRVTTVLLPARVSAVIQDRGEDEEEDIIVAINYGRDAGALS